METLSHLFDKYNEALVVLIARTFLGILFFFQGYEKVVKIKVSNVIETYRNDFENNGIPRFVTVVGSWFTSLTELICGALLIIGLFQLPALALLGVNLIVVAIAFGMNTPVWDTRYVLPRLLLLLFLLAVIPAWDAFSLDVLFSAK